MGKLWGMNEVSVKLFKIEDKQNYSRKNIFFRLYKMLTKKSLENWFYFEKLRALKNLATEGSNMMDKKTPEFTPCLLVKKKKKWSTSRKNNSWIMPKCKWKFSMGWFYLLNAYICILKKRYFLFQNEYFRSTCKSVFKTMSNIYNGALSENS